MQEELLRKNSILHKLYLIIISCFIGGVAISNYLLYMKITPVLSEAVNESKLKSANQVLSNITQELTTARSTATALANIARSTNINEPYLRTLAPEIMAPKGSKNNITGGGIWPEPFITDKNVEKNSLFWGMDSQQKLVLFNDYNQPSAKPYYQEDWYVPVRAIDPEQVFWSGAYVDPYTKQYMITVSAPIWKNDKYFGITTIDLNLDKTLKLIEVNSQAIGGYGFLVDKHGKFVFSPQSSLGALSKINFQQLQEKINAFMEKRKLQIDSSLGKDSPFFKLQNNEQESRVLLLNIPEIDWIICFITPEKVFTSPVNTFIERSAFYQLTVFSSCLVLIFLSFEHFFRKPFLSVASQLKTGDKILLSPGKKDELALLSELFNERTRQIHESKKELSENADMLQRALDSVHAGTMYYNVSKHTIDWDEGTSLIYDLVHKDITPNMEFLIENVHPDDIAGITNLFIAALEDPEIINYQVEYRVRLADNTYRPIRGGMKVVRDESGKAIFCNGFNFDLTEQKAAEASILDKEMAEESNRLKSEFLANMSHELRTPMHGILSFADFGIKKHGTAKREKLLQYFQHIQTSGKRLLILLNDLLDLSKVEAGKITLQKKKTDLNTIISHCCNEQQQRLADSKLTIDLNKQTDALVNIDSTRIGQVITNLLSNSIKYSPDGGVITITTKLSEDNKLHFSMHNQGHAIPPADIETIFDPFIQSNKPSSDVTGTGLGLAISREFITAHLGEIWAEKNMTTGAVFKFTIPI